MLNPMALGIQRESRKNKWSISDDFGLRIPVIQRRFRPKKVYFFRSTRPWLTKGGKVDGFEISDT